MGVIYHILILFILTAIVLRQVTPEPIYNELSEQPDAEFLPDGRGSATGAGDARPRRAPRRRTAGQWKGWERAHGGE